MAATEIQGADAAPVSIPNLTASGEVPPFSPELVEALSALLPAYIAERRWFRAKTRQIERVQVEDVIEFSATSFLFILRISYQQGSPDTYLLPLSVSEGLDDAVRNSPVAEPLAAVCTSRQRELLLYSAFANAAFRSSLLKFIDDSETRQGESGAFCATRISAPEGAERLNPNLESSVSRAEQSNTSVIYKDRYMLKLFRKVEEGINPDLEIGAFLTKRGFKHTPAVLGTMEYRLTSSGTSYAAGLLQRFVANRGDAWKYTLDSLAGFFDRAFATQGVAGLETLRHPLDLMVEPVPPSAEQLIGPYLQSARLLGTRTAEMHQALATGTDPDFVPEPLNPEYSQKLYSEMQRQADAAFEALRSKRLEAPEESELRHLVERESEVRKRFEDLQHTRLNVSRIRIHGDYHLGQVLYTGDDFMIIDFEGEPARPLEERRQKAIALRDVAGMIRSFQYAAYAALFGQIPATRLREAQPEVTSRWSAFWYAWASRFYLEGYLETAAASPFLPSSHQELRRLLDAFLLHKALYEVAYELNNRPAWVRIPVRGILSLLV